jgi:hypothetical protein
MPQAWEDSVDTPQAYDGVSSFVGGQFSYAKARVLKEDQASLLVNCEVAITGQASTRFGTSQLTGSVGSSTIIDGLTFMNAPSNIYEVALSGGDIYKWNGSSWVNIGGGSVSATNFISTNFGVPLNNHTVTVNGRVYTFKTTLTGAADEIHINGGDGSLTNLAAAINLTGTIGTDYGTGTTINADVSSSAVAASTITLTAKISGTSGNSLTLAKFSSFLLIGGATFSGGVGLTVTEIPSIVQGINKLYFAAGGDIYSWDGTTMTNISGDGATQAPRNASILRWHTNRLVVAGPNIKSLSTDPVAVPDAIYFSDILTPGTYNTTKNLSQIRVGGGDGIPITALVPWTNFNLAVFKRHSVWVINADPALDVSDMPVQLVHGTVGCIAPKSAVQVGSDILFLADDGIRSLSQVVGSDQQHDLSVPLSYPVQDIIERVNWTTAKSAASAFWRNLYIISLPLDGSTTNNYLLIYNTVNKSWQGTWTGLPVNCFSIREASGITRLMMGLSTTNKVVEYLDYANPSNWVDATFADYDGTVVQPRLKTKALVLGDPISIKIAIGGELEWNNSKGSLTVTPIIDEVALAPFTLSISGGGFTPPVTPPFLIGANGLSRYRFDMMRYGEFRELQFDIIGTGTGRKEIRQIAVAGIVRPALVGQS